MAKTKKKVISVDIDGTICSHRKFDHENTVPDRLTIKKEQVFSKIRMLKAKSFIDIDTKNDLLLAQSIAKNFNSKIGYLNYSNVINRRK